MKSKKVTVSDTNDSPPKRSPIFEFPPLPKWETRYYFAYILIGAVIVYPKIYTGSRDYKWDNDQARYIDSELPWFGVRRKDVTESEWRWWTPYARQIVPWLIGHSLIFNVSEKIFNQKTWSGLMLIFWVTACVYIYNAALVLTTIVFGTTVYTTMRYTKDKRLIWLVSMVLLYLCLRDDMEYLPEAINIYITIGFLSYKMLQYISFCLEECEKGRPENAQYFDGLYNMFWYSFYLPYLNNLIVIYRKFPNQIDQRRMARDWRHIIFFALRISFWFVFVEFSLHFLYFNAIITDVKYMYSTTEDEMLIMGYAAGLFFHLKYVIVFGVPAIFAKIDNMQPPKGPICISRVPLYAKVWRNFDRGLYEFFKEYIFLPICRPSFSIPRKFVGVLISYGFVLVWHGLEHQYFVWIILNIVELFIEIGAKSVYLIPSVRRWREDHLSDEMFRRIIALLTCCPWAIGAYANFYFLSDSEVGYVWVDRIFWGETVTFQYPFPLLVVSGYHLVNVCIDVDRWVTARENKKKLE